MFTNISWKKSDSLLQVQEEVRHFLNRDYKNTPPQKMSPLLLLEAQHIISLQYLLLPELRQRRKLRCNLPWGVIDACRFLYLPNIVMPTRSICAMSSGVLREASRDMSNL